MEGEGQTQKHRKEKKTFDVENRNNFFIFIKNDHSLIVFFIRN